MYNIVGDIMSNIEEYNKINDKIKAHVSEYINAKGLLNPSTTQAKYKKMYKELFIDNDAIIIQLCTKFYQLKNIIDSLIVKRRELSANILINEDEKENSTNKTKELGHLNDLINNAIKKYIEFSNKMFEGKSIIQIVSGYKAKLLEAKILFQMNNSTFNFLPVYPLNSLAIYEKYQEYRENMDLSKIGLTRHLEYMKFMREKDESGLTNRQKIRALEKEYRDDILLKNTSIRSHKTVLDISKYRALESLVCDMPINDQEIGEFKNNYNEKNKNNLEI